LGRAGDNDAGIDLFKDRLVPAAGVGRVEGDECTAGLENSD
jgi:hypothetical protein